jgi:hypothetical protein
MVMSATIKMIDIANWTIVNDCETFEKECLFPKNDSAVFDFSISTGFNLIRCKL